MLRSAYQGSGDVVYEPWLGFHRVWPEEDVILELCLVEGSEAFVGIDPSILDDHRPSVAGTVLSCLATVLSGSSNDGAVDFISRRTDDMAAEELVGEDEVGVELV